MATKYFMTGSSSNWSDDTNWSTTASSGPNNTTHAVAGDAVLLDAGSPACVIDAASATASIVCTGYTNTLTFNADLTCTSTVTFVSAMTIAGTSTLICNVGASTTLTSGGKTLTGGLTLSVSGNYTFTLTGNWVCNGLLTIDTTGGFMVINSGSISTGGGFTQTLGAKAIDISSCPGITITGGTWSGSTSVNTSSQYVPVTLAGNSTISGAVVCPRILTYSSGTITATGSTLRLQNLSVTIDVSAVTFDTVDIRATLARSATLSSNLNCATLNASNGSIYTVGGTGELNAASSTLAGAGIIYNTHINIAGTTSISGGTSFGSGSSKEWRTYSFVNNSSVSDAGGGGLIVLNGNGTWSGSGNWGSSVNLTINCPGSTLTISGTVKFTTSVGGGTLTYVDGTVVTTGSTLEIGASNCTFNTAGMVWNNITITAGMTVTNSSLLTASGTLTMSNADVTWTGAAGFTVGTLTNGTLTTTRTYTFKHGNTYTITGAMTMGTNGQTLNMTSDDATVRAFMPLDPAATQNVKLISTTRIDSSGGQTIVDYGGSLNDTINWILGGPPNIGFAR